MDKLLCICLDRHFQVSVSLYKGESDFVANSEIKIKVSVCFHLEPGSKGNYILIQQRIKHSLKTQLLVQRRLSKWWTVILRK